MKNTLFHRLKRPIAAAFVGALTTLAFAPYQIWLVALITPALLLILIHGQSRRQALWTGYAWGFGQFASGISWVYVSIAGFGGMPLAANLFLMGALIAYLAIYPALFTWSYQRFFAKATLLNLLLAAPALWLIADWLRGWVMTGFPWLWLGYSQIDSPLASFAPIGGVELLTLLLLVGAGAIAYAVIHKRWSMLLIPTVLLSTGYGLSHWDWVTPQPDKTTKVALIQGNVDQNLKWLPSQRWPTIMKYTDLSRENWDADIIIWPEAAIPAFEVELPSYLSNLDSAAKMNQSAIISGIVNQAEDGQFYNSILAVGLTPYGDYSFDLTERYHKHHLLPFGEFVPFESILRPLAPFFNLPMSSFSRGDFVQPNIVANGHPMAPALCYEIIFNEQVRQNVTDDTDFLLTLSNDAWFGRSIGPLQHMEIARMRALELGKPLIRSTNNGLTAVTDHRGKIIASIQQFETAVLRAELTPTQGQTPYHQLGSWPLYIWVALSLALAWWRKRRTSA
ncbi:TPA: apolipoprotein N-acyltransferase [Vibrio vulnificus]|uniref:apolipoprotein N-acyltransferase n=1 Tax=Vibrio vulnificus TaxID=672 RepID=UPI001A2E7407|nr:apolipoprotein N-acyltransferase [Vibrio vulnificus]MCG6277026.1 apolipoprotein N-acyltransferase [Vibrio vulnificus]HAS8172487.1 apolipoprotein N-acyltransferase [Vibrio vulnificus]HAS8446601.1 apolipoprotein N-acyltransferase [Vibrio vulnificus]HAS8448335.1 apolipoprotein N-acyltransferase [Vibrio vulnificus]HAS8455356.1 apolipoprotein N-acyltransferase [Vibrio vulnificus]